MYEKIRIVFKTKKYEWLTDFNLEKKSIFVKNDAILFFLFSVKKKRQKENYNIKCQLNIYLFQKYIWSVIKYLEIEIWHRAKSLCKEIKNCKLGIFIFFKKFSVCLLLELP